MAEVLPWAWLNGHLVEAAEASVSPFDRGFMFAEGAYEVIPVIDQVLWGGRQHLDRLWRSGRAIGLDLPDRAELEQAIQTLIRANGRYCQSLYIQVTSGAARYRDHVSGGARPTVFMMCQTMADPRDLDPDTVPGISVVTAPDFRWQRCDIKSVALLANVMLKRQALEKGADDAILVRQGRITEATAANVFVVREGEVITPVADEHILAGITRQLVLEAAAREGLAIEEGPVDGGLLEQADEIWLTSSTRHVVPVTRLNGQPVGIGAPGPVWKTVMLAYLRALKDEVASHS
ncbi:MAG: D-amino acid aminotransferase [Gammaproteobacteria bacterium]|nr:MAG: D-amino acid aminotransferase [Gammaproteobacteria bacterium]